VNAAKAFLRKAMKGQRTPTKITLDAYAASHRAVSDLKQSGELRNGCSREPASI
jgi:transposase-like protein